MSSSAENLKIEQRDVSVGTFVGVGESYFSSQFESIQKNELPFWNLNIGAALLPWLWAAWRGVWVMFWIALALDVIAVVCLMQVWKYLPILNELLLTPEGNSTRIARYSTWVPMYGYIGLAILVLVRFWMGRQANRWYFAQYNRWRVNARTASGISTRRIVLGLVILAICVPITTYRATQERLDKKACLTQLRSGETVQDLMAKSNAPSVDALATSMREAYQTALTEYERIDAKPASERTAEEKATRSKLRKQTRTMGRELKTVEMNLGLTLRDRFDCAFIDDFPTLARFQAPPVTTYQRVPTEDGGYEVVEKVGKLIEGRRVNTFTYVSEDIDTGITFLRAQYAGFFDTMTTVLRQSLIRVEVAFMLTPWPVVAFIFLALAWAYTSRATIAFVIASLAFLAWFELWQMAMQTMALVVVATALCIFVGLPLGIWMAKNKYCKAITEPILDVMQTIPSLSYLVPAVAFFGIGQPPAVIATVVFAIPPMVKLTALGIQQVPETTKEAALAFGATERQLLTKVELPMAIPSIMAGLNQTIMLALSMATISAMIGAAGLGALVTEALGLAEPGKGLLAGIAIALVAIMIDRILRGIRSSYSLI